MRFWIDTEYHHNGQNIELISLGAVSEDGREFYAISTEFDAQSVKPWVKEQVLPYLEPRSSSVWKSLSEIRQAFVVFVGDTPAEFWSYISTNDWYLVTNLLPGGLDGLPHKTGRLNAGISSSGLFILAIRAYRSTRPSTVRCPMRDGIVRYMFF